MQAYIAYKFKGTDSHNLRRQLIELDKTIKSAGFETFIFFRDVQKWGKIQLKIKELIEKAKQKMKNSDIIIAETSEKANGVYWEVGFFQGLGKPVIIIAKECAKNGFLASSTKFSIAYKNMIDLKEKLIAIRGQL